MISDATLLVNPTAGRGRVRAALPAVMGILQAAGLQVDLQISTSADHARQVATRTVGDGVPVLAVLGGDGLAHLAVQACAGLAPGRTTLGLIPGGTGNDLARGLGLDPEDPGAAARLIAEGRRQRFDLIRVGDAYVATVVATGFDVAVNRRANALQWPRGQARYVWATLAELSVFSPLRYRLTVDGRVRELEAMLVAVGNTRCYGGGLQICPAADPTDGLLDVTIIHPVNRFKLLQLLPRLPSGRFARDSCVEQFRASEVVVDGPGLIGHGDGEEIGPVPLTVQVAPLALEIFGPPDAGGPRPRG